MFGLPQKGDSNGTRSSDIAAIGRSKHTRDQYKQLSYVGSDFSQQRQISTLKTKTALMPAPPSEIGALAGRNSSLPALTTKTAIPHLPITTAKQHNINCLPRGHNMTSLYFSNLHGFCRILTLSSIQPLEHNAETRFDCHGAAAFSSIAQIRLQCGA
jgi:hypothetical protein